MSEIYRKFEVGVMRTEDGQYIEIGQVIFKVDNEDYGTAESMLHFQNEVKEFVANMVVIKPVEFTPDDFAHIEGL